MTSVNEPAPIPVMGQRDEQPAENERDENVPPKRIKSESAPEGYISRADLESILAERDRKHAAEIDAVRTRVPQSMVAAHSGGPGVDQHQQSWSLVEQEAAARGDILDHWETR